MHANYRRRRHRQWMFALNVVSSLIVWDGFSSRFDAFVNNLWSILVNATKLMNRKCPQSNNNKTHPFLTAFMLQCVCSVASIAITMWMYRRISIWATHPLPFIPHIQFHRHSNAQILNIYMPLKFLQRMVKYWNNFKYISIQILCRCIFNCSKCHRHNNICFVRLLSRLPIFISQFK